MMLMSALLLSLATVSLTAQGRPDFSGTWIEDESLREVTRKVETGGAQAKGLPARPITIKQTADTLAIEHEPPFPGWKPVRHVYNLAGRESVNHNGANTRTTRSRWEGSKLVTEGTSFSETSQGEFTWKYLETIWLDSKGRLITETRTTDEAGKTHVVRRTYRKK